MPVDSCWQISGYREREIPMHKAFGMPSESVETSLDTITLESLKDPPPGEKPVYSYVTLVKVAIWSSPRKMLTLREIYDALEERFPYFKECENPKSWKTSIRHSLSLVAMFKKTPAPLDFAGRGRGNFWTLDLTKPEGNKRVRKRGTRKTPIAKPTPSTTEKRAEARDPEEEAPIEEGAPIPVDPILLREDASQARVERRGGSGPSIWNQTRTGRSGHYRHHVGDEESCSCGYRLRTGFYIPSDTFCEGR